MSSRFDVQHITSSSRFDVQHITSGFLLFFGSPNPKKCPMLTAQIAIMSNNH